LKVIKLHKNLDNSQTIHLLRKQNREIQHQVYSFYAPKMLGVCRQYIKDLQQAEEVLLNGFLKVFTKIDSFNEKGSFEGWIRRIMVNECISFLRIKKNVFITDAYKEAIIEETDADEKIINTDYLQKLIDNLKPDLRIVFNLYVVEEYKHKEIAEMLNITVNASKLRYKKAKQLLQDKIKLNTLHYGK